MNVSNLPASDLLSSQLGPVVQDAEEGAPYSTCLCVTQSMMLTSPPETFLLFSQDIPSNNLGFVDQKAEVIELEIAGREYFIRQSPGLLNSNNHSGTTGAVLWKVTPLLAEWLSSRPPILAALNALHPQATVVELGCGLNGLIGQVLSHSVRRYVFTDLPFIIRHLKTNLVEATPSRRKHEQKHKKPTSPPTRPVPGQDVLQFCALNWETDEAETLNPTLTSDGSIDLVILCDCVYNEYLVKPLVQTCADICRLGQKGNKPPVMIIAQQLRSDIVFEEFLDKLIQHFNVWRVPGDKILSGLGTNSGYVVHLAILKDMEDGA
ncbi:hypothetical protein PV10_01002 [Exophiala mesophila]|uniref:Diaminohydroxyphosphoribosylamino-pyrimidine deaminase n=1 Tax=Exophiala mesophila TaxID=212818 RepID=A0A0D1ZRI9_EXOME|nr:uncharacterized protein PV10_01002 [Exophiala mesophila]KIV97227.1 hypothetical protein PV10_01002 [Exophiala mesophila]